MSTLHSHHVTAAQLARLPDDGKRYELVEGGLRMMSPAGGEHGRVAMNLALHLGQHVKTHRLGIVFAAETGFLLSSSPDTVRAADVAYVSQQRLNRLESLRGYLPLAPDLVAEVVSSSERSSQVTDKAQAWIAAGVRLVLVVDPESRTVRVYQAIDDVKDLGMSDTLDASPVVPGWKLPFSAVFG